MSVMSQRFVTLKSFDGGFDGQLVMMQFSVYTENTEMDSGHSLEVHQSYI